MDYKNIIDSKGLKISWLAKQIGVSRPMLSMFISGQRNLKPYKKEVLHKLLNVE